MAISRFRINETKYLIYIYIYIERERERERERPNIRKHGVLSRDTFYIKRIEIFLSVIFLSATSNIRTN